MNTRTRMHRGPAAIIVRRKRHFHPMPGVQGRRATGERSLATASTPRNLNDSIQCPKYDQPVPLRAMNTHRRACFHIL